MSNYSCYGPVESIKLKAVKELPERTCYDFYEGKAERKSTNDPHQFLMDALTNKDQMLLWVQLAYQIFESEPDTCWNHSNKTWEKNFGKDPNYMDLIDCLCHKCDKTGGDPHMSTGLITAGCLDDVEQAAGKLVEKLLSRKLKANDFINRCPIEPLHGKTDKQQVYYTLAAHLDKYGGTQQFCYNVFGLAFYNFRLKVVSDGTTPYNTAIGKRDVKDAIREGGISGFKCQESKKEVHSYLMENRSKLEVTQTATLETSVTETESNSITNAEEYSYTESCGLDVMVQDILKVNEITVHLGFEASQVIQTAYTKDHTVSNSKQSSSIAEVILPPHTSIMVRKTANDVVTTLKYDCPVMVQFDVAVISMCGTFYDDNLLVQAFGTAGYDQRSFYTLFKSAEVGDAG
ncbi:MAG: aerolysin family beta-barrel pore-forming toxin, partial [Lachnospiraceae bacterium]|nr:aerolysin family beta-barrel pore-forming toxin [Lachnospiraceae bacterium]